MREQPPEKETWTPRDQLMGLVETAGVESVDAVWTVLDNDNYADRIRETAADAAEAGIDRTLVGDRRHSTFTARSHLDTHGAQKTAAS